MEGFKRAAGASVVALAVLALAPAAHAAGVGVTEISSLPAGAKAGNLSGLVTNDGDSAAKADRDRARHAPRHAAVRCSAGRRSTSPRTAPSASWST